MNYLMVQYISLQALDFLTTLAFLAVGVEEANPIVRVLLSFGSTPAGGLLLVKIGALLLGLYCWRMGRQRLLGRVNVFFAILVVWNLVALGLGHFAS